MQHRTLALGLSLLLPVTSLAAAMTDSMSMPMGFSDVPKDAWYSQYVDQAASLGIVSGYEDTNGKATGKFGPGDDVTLAQALKIAINGSGFDAQSLPINWRSDDPLLKHWAAAYINVAQQQSFDVFATGVPSIDAPATRAQVASLIADAFKVNQETTVGNNFNDVRASTESAFAIEALTRDGIVSGDTDSSGKATGYFRPTDPIVRAEVVKMVIKAREFYGEPGMATSSSAVSSESSSSSAQATILSPIITYTDAGFSPSTTTIVAGTSIIIKNESSNQLLFKSDPHPTHTDDPELNTSSALKNGEQTTLLLNTKGTFGFHNHLNPGNHGTIIIK